MSITLATLEPISKIVYYGPETLNLRETLDVAHDFILSEDKSAVRVLEEDAASFDFVTSLTLGNYRVRFQPHSMPKSRENESLRKRVLEGLDGVVFVADVRPSNAAKTLQAWNSLKFELTAVHGEWKKIPIVIQLPAGASPYDPDARGLRALLGINAPLVDMRGGVGPTLKRVMDLTVWKTDPSNAQSSRAPGFFWRDEAPSLSL